MPRNRLSFKVFFAATLAGLLLGGNTAMALESDRQKTLMINADDSDGTFGDGKSTLRGNVEIRQGTLLVKADIAEVEKAEGKVRDVRLSGGPALLQQEIENEGLVIATANHITYQVATGIVTLTGNADVNHPQYKISGELLVYDLNKQHFQGSGGDNNGRIRIQMEPEVISNPGLETIDDENSGEENPGELSQPASNPPATDQQASRAQATANEDSNAAD